MTVINKRYTMIKNVSAIAALCLGISFLLTCSRQNTLYDPSGIEPARCFALLSDSLIENPTLADTIHLVKSDTIHTGDPITFIGIITPANADLKSVKWDFGDGKDTSVALAVHRYLKGGKYTSVFTIEDKVGLTLSDTVTVCVNTPPSIDSLVSPVMNDPRVNPKTFQFQWRASDPDSSDTAKISIYFDTTSALLQSQISGISGRSTYSPTGELKALTTYYWKIVAIDQYGFSDTSVIQSFKTIDPDRFEGALKGYALYQGWKNHRGIKIVARDANALYGTAVTDSAGYFFFPSLSQKANYWIIAMDTLKRQFIADTVYDTVFTGAITIADTLLLKDPFKPGIAGNAPQGIQTIRQPVVSSLFSDCGSGVNATTASVIINDSCMTDGVVATDTGIRWTPPSRLADGDYTVKIAVSDSAGNRADTMKWSFTVDAMKLSILTQQDTLVRINDTVRIHSIVNNVFSKVTQYKWDFDGDGIWDDSINVSDTIVSRPHVFKHDTTYNTVVYARDDSGMVKYDTVRITVGNLPPVISSIRPDDTISIRDSIQLFGTATDVDGTIKEYAWDFNGDGTFEYKSATNINAGHRYNTVGTYNAVLRVTDDDNKVAFDSTRIFVVQDTPQVNFISGDTIVDHGGTVRCSVYVQQQFGTMTVEIDTANSGNFKMVGSLGLSGGKACSFKTGNACSWDSVKVRITDDDGNVGTRGFRVRIRPRPLTITSIDSTVNTITIHYSQTQESDFVQYRIYRNTTNTVDTNSELWATISASGKVDTTSTPNYAWTPRYYRVYQKDNGGLWSAGSNVVYGNIINSPPATPVITYPANDGDTVWSDETLRWTKCLDINGQAVKYMVEIKFPSPGYAICDTLAAQVADTFVPLHGYDSLGIKIKVVAFDGYGGSSVWTGGRTANLKWAGRKGMRFIPGGTFQMGQAGIAEPVHDVTLTRNFYMDTTEVTQGNFLALMGVNPSGFTGDANRPVEQVTWFDAVLYCNARGKHIGLDTVYSYTSLTGTPGNGCTGLGGLSIDMTRNGYRLPTEAEWEYSCRAGTTTAYYWADDTIGINNNGWSNYNSGNATHTVATKLPNAWGLYDMAGNVWEWCNDWYEGYSSDAQTDPTGAASGIYRVLRGGSCYNGSDDFRSAHRLNNYPDDWGSRLGFRVVLPR
jgi:formylglycine-generating enzyme